jgi:hypothetical protein
VYTLTYKGLDIHKTYSERRIPSSEPTREYFIACSDVNWNDGKGIRKKVIYTLVIRNNKIEYYPAHILPNDLDQVLNAIEEIRKDCNI